MRPEVIVHNTVSVDGCAAAFDIDIGLHYEIAGQYGAQATLMGSETTRRGLELFGEGATASQAQTDAPRADPADPRPLWALVDSRGLLLGRLHALWGAGFCRGLVVAIAEGTPTLYREYLRQRKVEHHVLGEGRVDLARFLDLLGDQYGVRRVLVDSGPTLFGVLLGEKLVDRLSLVVAPRLAATSAILFGKLRGPCALSLEKTEPLRDGCVHLEYRVARG